jgi:cytochrome c551/c552
VTASFAVTAALLLMLACAAAGPPPGTPEALYVDLGCAKCHGTQREGQRNGPPLTNLTDRWNHESLVEFLQDPQGFIDRKPSLAYRFEKYAIAMHAFGTTPEPDLHKLAGWLLDT